MDSRASPCTAFNIVCVKNVEYWDLGIIKKGIAVMIKKLALLVLLNVGGSLLASNIEMRRRRSPVAVRDFPAPQIPEVTGQAGEISGRDLAKALVATCCFPCLLLASRFIINNDYVSKKNS